MSPDWFGWALFMAGGIAFIYIVERFAPDGPCAKRRRK